ncbi:MAG: ABC transporter substrate-binding protein [Gammaproteobacteria bacterium]|nr:ABC transporter substrate-binding protein [Gammaproteobacteria bacterium]
MAKASLLAGLLALLSGCQAPEPPLRVAMIQWVGYQPLHLAQTLGYFGGQPIRLADFNSNIESLRAFRNGDVEVAALTLDEVLLLHADAHDAHVVLVMDYSQGADAIVSRPEYPDMASLKGKRVGVENTAAGAYMLARALEQAGLTSDAVEIVKVGAENQAQAYRDGSVDVLVTYEPLRTQLVNMGAREQFNSTQIPGEIVDVLAVRGSVLKERPEAIAALLSGWFRALDYAQAHPDDTAQRLAPRLELSAAEYRQAVAGIRLPALAENCALLNNPATQLGATVARVHALMIRMGLLTARDAPGTDILDALPLRSLGCDRRGSPAHTAEVAG